MKRMILLCLTILSWTYTHYSQALSLAKTEQGKQPIGLVNYGNNQQVWLKKLHDLAKGEANKFRILQLGDSHTAADYFTGELRSQLQTAFGNAGIGWIYPAKIKGQRMALVDYQGNVPTFSSRRDQGNFPMGGTIALLTNAQQSETIIPRNENDLRDSSVTFTIHPTNIHHPLLVTDGMGRTFALNPDPDNQNDWQYISFKATPPLTYRAQADDTWTLGNINIENNHKGIIVSAMGINGAQLTELKKWRNNWWQDLYRTQADLVILSYGSNESYETILSPNTMAYWQETINTIHRVLPNAGILVIGAPEILRVVKGKCGSRSPSLDTIQNIQQQLAKENGLLYWSWQNAMGGRCSMKKWIAQGLGRSDGVHFTAKGYERSARSLAHAMIEMAKKHH